jgi:vancomycin permeability regulator SanA
VIESGCVREIDLFEANGSPFVQMAGVGFDARVIEETTWESKKMLGPLAYLLAAVKVLGEKPPLMEVVCADGRREQGVAVLAGNGSLYGGQFRFFRNADNRDSKLDVLVYKEAGYKLVLDSLRGLALGGIDLMESTSAFQTRPSPCMPTARCPWRWTASGSAVFPRSASRKPPGRLRVLAPEQARPPEPSPRPSWRGSSGRAASPNSKPPASCESHHEIHCPPALAEAAADRGRAACLAFVTVVAYANITAVWASRGRIFSDVSQIPVTKVGLVFGTTDRIGGRENLYFRYRIDAAAEALERRQGGNPHRFRRQPLLALLRRTGKDAPGARCTRHPRRTASCDDGDGMRTLDSVVRAKEIFGADTVLFISQRFQIERAIYLAKAHGINAYGFEARDVESHAGLKTRIREIGARVKMWLDVNFLNTRPQRLGEKETLPD